VNAPRVHHQHLPDQVYWENRGLPEGVVAELEARGHTMSQRGGSSGDVQAILRLPDGTLTVYSDPRLGGVARALP
jgi:gamma-glutamyltranspeptidase / glutathione hydrolase